MSGASATVSAAPAAPASAVAPPTAAAQAPETSPPAGPVQSFTEVLSAQRAESRRDGGDRHDADAKRDPAHGETVAAPAKGGRPSSAADPSQPPAASPVGAAPVSESAVSFARAAEDPTDPSTAPEGGSAVHEGATGAGPAHATRLPEAGLANASTDTGTATGAPGAKVPTAAAPAAAVAEPGDQDPAADGPDSAVAPPSSPTDEAAAVGLAATRSPSAALPARSGGAGESGTAAAHTASTPVEAAGLPNSSPTPAPLPHLLAESPLAPSGAPRGAGAALPVGGAAASSAPTIAQQAASALDVDDLSGSISRPLSDGNGTYTVTVALHPPELGHVQAVMSLEGNDLVVSLTAQTQTGHDALASASEALKNQLARGGVNVNVTLRDPGSQAGADERYRPPTSPGSAGPLMTGSAATETPLSSGLVSGQIHLVL